tara:strand:- start:118 stop:258 length:141 start_codon:yes stop_codon:yes gene_type:complete
MQSLNNRIKNEMSNLTVKDFNNWHEGLSPIELWMYNNLISKNGKEK